MTRFFTIMLAVVIAGLLAAPAWASIPYPPYCTKVWVNTIDDSAIGICPAGDYTRVDVCIRGLFNEPLPNRVVTVTVDCPQVIWCPAGNQGTTLANGCVTIYLKGGINWPGPLAKWCKVTVTCESVIIEEDYFYILSPDFNGSLLVDATDFAVFAGQWGKIQLDNCANFSRVNPKVDGTDFAIFASHWKHHCP